MARRLTKSQKALVWAIIIINLVIILVMWYQVRTTINPPRLSSKIKADEKVSHPEKDFYYCENDWLQKSNSGLWELYIEGAPFKRGVIEGKLTKDLIEKQEKAFIGRLQEMIPSSFYQHFLKYFIYWFNRDLDKYVSAENKLQIFGISLSASDKYSFMGSKYQRMLNYHSAHDIGHALVNMGMVGCTSFGVWNGKSKTGKLLVGRNFDFYMGDEFSQEKIVCFEKPDKGYPFMIVTWGGMIGAVSGMNEKGLTVTINAARSELPKSAKTPISLVAREILQYASNISQAADISKKHETFVSESILVGSAEDNKAVILEKSPSGMEIVESTTDYIICTNHFQSAQAQSDPAVIKDMKENATSYRYKKVNQDLNSEVSFDVNGMAGILRDRSGLGNDKPGDGNEKAINQLIAHHSIIFEPSSRRAWVSTTPWQEGPFVCYDLCKIFHNFAGLKKKVEIQEPDQEINPDPLFSTADYERFLQFKKMREKLRESLKSGNKGEITDSFIREFIGTNRDFFEVYELAGDHYCQLDQPGKGCVYYKEALSKIIPGQKERGRIIKKLAGCLVDVKN